MSLITTLRKPRIFKIALFDVITSILGLFMIFKFIFKIKHSFLIAILLTFPIGILVHYVFKIPTTLNYYLGLSKKPKQ